MSDKKKSGAKKAGAQKSSGGKLKITLTRSLIGRPEKHRRVAKALGLRRMNQPVIQDETPTIRGMVNKISHLLTVEGA